MKITLERADYCDTRHAQAISYLLNYYAKDPMGGGKGLDAYVIANIAGELSRIPHAFSVICYVDDQAAGLINCFEGFSTFKCQALINIHDVIVVKEFRGHGICRHMLAEIEQIARQKKCCKLTLEVLQGNLPAQQVYKKFGFVDYELDAAHGKALFWEKTLAAEP